MGYILWMTLLTCNLASQLQFMLQEGMAFCEECVLSDKEEPCDAPEAFYDAGKFGGLRP